MKKTLLSILFLTISMVSALAAVGDTFSEGGVTYEVTSDDPKTVKVSAFTDEMPAELTIPTAVSGYSVTLIGQGAFYNCTALTSVKIPDSVTKIDWLAFFGCTNLASVEIPGSVTIIFRDSFYNCSALTSIEIPNSVTSIGKHAFYSCTNLKEVTISDGDSPLSFDADVFKDAAVETLYLGRDFSGTPFKGLETLNNLTISNSVTSLPANAFAQCTALSSIEIPASVTSLGFDVFSDCINLYSITCLATVPPTASDETFLGFYKEVCTLTVPNGSVDAYKEAPNWDGFKEYEAILAVGDTFTVDGVTYKVTSDDPKTVMVNGYTDEIAADLTLPEEVNGYAVTAIGDEFRNSVFADCQNLRSIVIPSSVTYIGMGAFRNCTNLTSLTCLATVPPTTKSTTFDGFDKSACTLTVPEGSEAAYKADENWDGFKSDNTTSIESVGADTINLTINGTEVTVTGTDECVRVYDLSGRAILTTSERTFSLPSGVAIIVVAGHTFRLAI